MLNSKNLLNHTQKLSVLFAEDHEDLRENVTEILKTFFHTVNSSSNGEEALAQYRQYSDTNAKHYDIVISDIRMPRLNGVELVEKIYKINPNQIIIIVSAHDDTKYLLPLINLGIQQFIKKPIDYQEFLKALLNASKNVNNLTLPNVEQKQESLIKLNDSFSFCKNNSILQNTEEIIPLTKYEIIFLQLLTNNIGKIFPNEDITAEYKAQNENLDIVNIRKLVSKLRKKLPSNCVESIYGIGYRILPYNQA
ncbi:MAG: response regulator transcription factor [Sulfurimonas sp.]|uniref:response regulator transcription factor n=1 Tax=Sulfurimonas sp. TaxID=2022749 RepID=UPI0026030282|nr:response regulator transcription factor [Sulfurimonas sp.]MCW8894910.1 response regulator transcription factor [Sulfurimonas sp.]MCW8954817.1 response regulator transcription factor [Sulfurimonas sp.]MCW9068190.1 response regulator transcription factor [Sulfurimonas sp.]